MIPSTFVGGPLDGLWLDFEDPALAADMLYGELSLEAGLKIWRPPEVPSGRYAAYERQVLFNFGHDGGYAYLFRGMVRRDPEVVSG